MGPTRFLFIHLRCASVCLTLHVRSKSSEGDVRRLSPVQAEVALPCRTESWERTA